MLMNLNSHSAAWEAEWVCFTEDGEPVPVYALSITIEYDEDALRMVRLRFRVEGDWVRTLQEADWFNLEPENRRPPGAMLLETDMLEVEAVLAPELLEELPNSEDALLIIEALADAPETSLLRHSSYWYALDVKQPVTLPPELEGTGTLMAGYVTRWHDELATFLEAPESLYRTLLNMFYTDGWDYTIEYERYLIRADFEGDEGEAWEVVGLVRPDEHFVLLYSRYPEPIPAERRMAMAEFITRANFDLPIGNFELNLESGELRFKTSLELEPSSFSDEAAYDMLLANLSIMQLYWVGIRALVAGDSPQEALRLVED